MDKTKIIVVEDNIVYCEFVCNLLTREGFRTVKAFHYSTAKKYLQQATENDIIVSDLRLPDGDGIDLLRWMRKEGMMQPFIIMDRLCRSAYGSGKHETRLIRLYTQAACGGQTRPSTPYPIKRTEYREKPYASVLP